MSRARIAVLASGGGSNLQAILDYLAELDADRSGDVTLVVTDRPAVRALDRARLAGVPGVVSRSRFAPDALPIGRLLDDAAPDVVALAGYLQLLPSEVTQQFQGRMINVHPGPLPAFGGAGMYGSRVHRRVLSTGASDSGPTVHFVDEEYDHGAVIAHWPVPVLAGDDEHSLAARVLRAEHLLFPPVVNALAAGAIALTPSGIVPPFLRSPLPLFDEQLNDHELAHIIANASRTSLGI